MRRAEIMIAQYAEAGFVKIHLDASMSCQGDPETLSDEIIAGRAARLARIAESNCRNGPPFYVIGTEVPVPGGASQGHDLAVTTPEAAARTLAVHKQAFHEAGLGRRFRHLDGRTRRQLCHAGSDFRAGGY